MVQYSKLINLKLRIVICFYFEIYGSTIGHGEKKEKGICSET